MKSDANTFENRLGANLKDLRAIAGLTQAELAKKLGLSSSSIAHYESGINIPTIKVISAYADYFGTSVDYILGKISIDTDYKCLMEKASTNITYGEILKLMRSLPEIERTAFIELLIAISKRKNKP